MRALSLNASPERCRARLKEAIAERRPRAAALGIGESTAFTSRQLGRGPLYQGRRSYRFGRRAFGMIFVAELSRSDLPLPDRHSANSAIVRPITQYAVVQFNRQRLYAQGQVSGDFSKRGIGFQ